MTNDEQNDKDMDLIQQCIRDDSIAYGFVISNQKVDEFIQLVKEKGKKEGSVLNSLVDQWIKANRKG
ncbi:hypothetical protein ACTL6P_25295 [Endozoicomonas acroporae]|uniref:hypothetical protein n=1 Tax=Endozoicomonas acroporae TaxID=1701104 RepID=UPI000C785C51|nr:hypothetical protein [Endozoicomonas acroporae]